MAVANLVYQEHLVRSHLSVMPTTKEQNVSVNDDEKRNGTDKVLCPAAIQLWQLVMVSLLILFAHLCRHA